MIGKENERRRGMDFLFKYKNIWVWKWWLMDDKCNDLTIPKWIEINSIVLKMMMETWQMWECKQIGEPWEDRAPCKPEERWVMMMMMTTTTMMIYIQWWSVCLWRKSDQIIFGMWENHFGWWKNYFGRWENNFSRWEK